jgi:hypothetical protein
MTNAPVEPEETLDLSWSIMFLFSDNELGRELGKQIRDRINTLVDTEQNPNKKAYLTEISTSIFGTARVLAYRATGMRQYINLFNETEEKKLKELNDLASITNRPASLVPRVISAIAGGALGSVSLPQLLEKTANFIIPQYGPLSGYDLFIIFIILGSSVGYTVIELILRLYRMRALPRILVQTQTEKSIAWNRFVRECREAMRNLLLFAIKSREKYFPNLPTYDGKKFFAAENNISVDEMNRFHDVLDSIIIAKGPQVRNQMSMKPKLFGKTRSCGTWKFRIQRGDVVSGSFASHLYKRLNFFYYEISNEDMDPTIDRPLYKREKVFADEYSLVSRTDGWGILIFENRSFVRSISISFSCEIARYDLRLFGL